MGRTLPSDETFLKFQEKRDYYEEFINKRAEGLRMYLMKVVVNFQ